MKFIECHFVLLMFFFFFCLFQCQCNSMPNVHWKVYISVLSNSSLTFNAGTHENSLFCHLIENNSSFVRYLVYLFSSFFILPLTIPIANARHSNLLFQHFDWSASIPELNGLWKDKVCTLDDSYSNSCEKHHILEKVLSSPVVRCSWDTFRLQYILGRSTWTYIRAFLLLVVHISVQTTKTIE